MLPRNLPGSDDVAWVDSLKSGNDTAFDRLVESSRRPLLAIARRVLRHEQDAEDAVQDAFVSAFRGLRAFAGGSRVSTWMHRIGVNAALMRQRGRARRPAESLDAASRLGEPVGLRPIVSVTESDDGSSGIQRLVRDETRAFVRQCIDLLPETHKEVIRLRDFEGADTDATARRLGISANAAKIRLHRAHRALRSLLEQRLVAA